MLLSVNSMYMYERRLKYKILFTIFHDIDVGYKFSGMPGVVSQRKILSICCKCLRNIEINQTVKERIVRRCILFFKELRK